MKSTNNPFSFTNNPFSFCQPQLKLRKAFTLVEILIVVIIVGLLSGIVIMKMASAKDLAQLNYLKATMAFLDKGIQQVAAQEGTFPTVPDGTPAERVVFIMQELESRNMVVFLENTYGEKWVTVNKNFIQPLLASQANDSMAENIAKIRGIVSSGDPFAKEILVMPRGVIVYPTTPDFTVNDPANPDHTYHYASYYLPKLVNQGIQNLLNGGFANEEERNLVLSNIGLVSADEEVLKGLLLNTDNRAQATLAAMQLVNTINGTLEGAQMSPEVAQRLLDQMLSNENYDPQGVDLSSIDITKFNPLSLSRVAQNASLTPDQVNDLMALNRPELKANLMQNTYMSDASYSAFLDTALTSGNLSQTTFNDFFYPIQAGAPANLGRFVSHLAEIVTPEKAAQTLNMIGNLMNSSGVPSDKKAELFAATYAALSTQYPTINPGDSVAQQAFNSAIQMSATYGTESNETREAMAIKLLGSATPGQNFNSYSITNALNAGKMTATPALTALAVEKLINGASNTGGIIDKGAAYLNGTQVGQVQAWIGTDSNRLINNSKLVANPLIYNTPESLQGVVAAALGNASVSHLAAMALKNSNLSGASRDAIFNAVVANPGGYNSTSSAVFGDAAALAAFTPSQKSALIAQAIAAMDNPSTNNLIKLLPSMANIGAITPTERASIISAMANSTLEYNNGFMETLFNGVPNTGLPGITLTSAEIQTLSSGRMDLYGDALVGYLAGNNVGNPKTTVLSAEGKQALLTSLVDTAVDRNYVFDKLNAAYSTLDSNMKTAVNDYMLSDETYFQGYSNSYNISSAQLNDLTPTQKNAVYAAMENAGVQNNLAGYDQTWMTESQFDSFVNNHLADIESGSVQLYRSGPISEPAAEALYGVINNQWTNGNPQSFVAQLDTVINTGYAQSQSAQIASYVSSPDLDGYASGELVKKLLNSSGSPQYLASLKASATAVTDPEIMERLLSSVSGLTSPLPGSTYGGQLLRDAKAADYMITIYKQAEAIGVDWKGQVHPYLWGKEAFDSLSFDDKQWLNAQTGFMPLH